jgi:MFS family permease
MNSSKSVGGEGGRDEHSLFDHRFWLGYASNIAFLIATSAQVRYSDFVLHHLDGTESQLGWITGLGMLGAIVGRFALGRTMDRIGPSSIWIGSVILYAIAVLGHLQLDAVDTWPIYAARTALALAIAGVMGALLTFVSLRSPPSRVPEAVGVLGSSGFIGLAIGPMVADGLMGATIDRSAIERLFIGSATAATAALVFAFAASFRADLRRRNQATRRSSGWRLTIRYQSALAAVAAVSMGVGISLPSVFLKPYLDETHVGHVRDFFLIYAITGFVARLTLKNIVAWWGYDRVIVRGLWLIALGLLLFLMLQTRWAVLLPAMVGGIGHSIAYPALVSASIATYPRRHRGLAMTVILAMIDVGSLTGFVLAGKVVTVARWMQWPPYPTMFSAIATAIGLTAITYALCTGRNELAAGRNELAAGRNELAAGRNERR